MEHDQFSKSDKEEKIFFFISPQLQVQFKYYHGSWQVPKVGCHQLGAFLLCQILTNTKLIINTSINVFWIYDDRITDPELYGLAVWKNMSLSLNTAVMKLKDTVTIKKCILAALVHFLVICFSRIRFWPSLNDILYLETSYIAFCVTTMMTHAQLLSCKISRKKIDSSRISYGVWCVWCKIFVRIIG